MKKKSKVKSQKSKFSTIILFFLLFFTAYSSLLTDSFAQTAASESEAVEVEKKENLEEEIEKIRKEVEKKVEEKRAFFGKVTDLFNQTIILETKQGEKTNKIDSECSFVDENRKKISFEDLEIDSFLITMGYAENEERLLAKRVVVVPEPKKENRIAVMGRIDTDGNEKLVIESLDETSTWQATVTPKTKFSQRVEGKIEEIKIETDEIEADTLVMVVGVLENEKEIEASLIHLLLTKEASPTPIAEE